MADTELAALTEPVAGPAPKARSRVRYNQAMRLVRRAHLYTGLFMTPWVFLYGVTALLFNHPDAFPDQEVHHLGAADLAGTPLEDFPKAATLAARVVDQLNRDAGAASPGSASKAEARPARLVRPAEAQYARDLFAMVQGDGHEYTVRLDLDAGKGSVRVAEKAELPRRGRGEEQGKAESPRRGGRGEPEKGGGPRRGGREEPEKGGAPGRDAAGAISAVRLDPSPLDRVKAALPVVLARLGFEGGEPVMRFSPELAFLMERDGRSWRARYNLQTGELATRPPDQPAEPMSTRRFLLRLHMAHGYPSDLDARWVWAVAVDLMFASMVGWGITGLLMWWQMKNVRRIGAVILVLSAVVATAVAVGMHGALTS